MSKTTDEIAEQHEGALARAIEKSAQETQRLANMAAFERSIVAGDLQGAMSALHLENLEKKLING